MNNLENSLTACLQATGRLRVGSCTSSPALPHPGNYCEPDYLRKILSVCHLMTKQIFCFRDVFPYDTNAYCVIVRLSVCGWNEECRVFQAAPVKQVPLTIPDLKWSSRTYQLPCSGGTSWERSICGTLLRWCLSGTFSTVTQVLSRWSGPFTLFFHYLWLLSSFKRNDALKCSRRRKWHFRQQVIVIHYFIFDFLLIVFKFTQVQK